MKGKGEEGKNTFWSQADLILKSLLCHTAKVLTCVRIRPVFIHVESTRPHMCETLRTIPGME